MIDFSPMKKKDHTPKVGVGVIIKSHLGIGSERKFLLGLRKGSHGAGEWSLPGGHLEIGESFVDCVRREVKEETDLDVDLIRPVTFTNDIFASEGLHYVTLFFIADVYHGEVKNMEPDKCERWEWVDKFSLPKNIFPTLKNLLNQETDAL
jgi:8-oxo-dGTP diphosphatase